MKGRRHVVKEGFISPETIEWRHGLCMCAIQRVNGQDKRLKCLWTGYGSKCQAHRFECFQELQRCWFFQAQPFPVCFKNGPPSKGHPANLTQPWEALKSTWDSIPVKGFQHLVEYIPRRIEAVLSAKGKVVLMFYTVSVYGKWMWRKPSCLGPPTIHVNCRIIGSSMTQWKRSSAAPFVLIQPQAFTPLSHLSSDTITG